MCGVPTVCASNSGAKANLTGGHVVWLGAVEGFPGALDECWTLPVAGGARAQLPVATQPERVDLP